MERGSSLAAQERMSENDVEAIDHLRDAYARLRKELGRVIVGQRDVIERLAICLFARGHALLDGRAGAGQDPAGQQAGRDDVAASSAASSSRPT